MCIWYGVKTKTRLEKLINPCLEVEKTQIKGSYRLPQLSYPSKPPLFLTTPHLEPKAFSILNFPYPDRHPIISTLSAKPPNGKKTQPQTSQTISKVWIWRTFKAKIKSSTKKYKKLSNEKQIVSLPNKEISLKSHPRLLISTNKPRITTLLMWLVI